VKRNHLLQEELNLIDFVALLSGPAEQAVGLLLNGCKSASLGVRAKSLLQVLHVHLLAVALSSMASSFVLISAFDPSLPVDDELLDLLVPGLEMHKPAYSGALPVGDGEESCGLGLLAVGCPVDYHVVEDLVVGVLVDEYRAEDVTVEADALREGDECFKSVAAQGSHHREVLEQHCADQREARDAHYEVVRVPVLRIGGALLAGAEDSAQCLIRCRRPAAR
jgi:hypothetical protein